MNVNVSILDGPVPRSLGEQHPPDGDAGAVLTFLGVVRELEDDRPLTAIRYETYDPMAELELTRLANETASRFRLISLDLVHSRGVVPVGEPSLSVEIRSAHRREGLDAMDWLIDALKQDVPIWKHPVFTDDPSTSAQREGGYA